MIVIKRADSIGEGTLKTAHQRNKKGKSQEGERAQRTRKKDQAYGSNAGNRVLQKGKTQKARTTPVHKRNGSISEGGNELYKEKIQAKKKHPEALKFRTSKGVAKKNKRKLPTGRPLNLERRMVRCKPEKKKHDPVDK